MITFDLMLENISYNDSTIHFGPLNESSFEKVLEQEYPEAKKIIITDEIVYELWIQDLITNYASLANAEIIQIPVGEEFKTIDVSSQIWSALSEYEVGRGDLIINFGGGVITDLGGFVASLFKRGLDFINIPTTLLAQVDASVGGKTGVDLRAYKNQIGIFSDASHVFIDDRYLETLEADQLLSGYAEMLKHGLICDKDYWNELKSFDSTKTEGRLSMIAKSVQLKKEIVEADHLEAGPRKVLNFGHTIGHGIEGYLLNEGKSTLHGYAVAWGMMAESAMSFKKGMLNEEEFNEIKTHLSNTFPQASISENDFEGIMKLLYNDKKNINGEIQFSLLSGIGNCEFNQVATNEEILAALKTLIS